LRKLGEATTLDELLYVLRAFLDADAALRESPHPRVELEVAAIRATRRPVPSALEEILQRVDEAAQRLRQSAPAAPAARAQESLLTDEAAVGVARPVPASSPRGGPVGSPVVARDPSPASERNPASARERSAKAMPERGAGPAPERPAGASDRRTRPAADAPAASSGPVDAGARWSRVVEDVMRRKPTLGAVLAQSRPGTLLDGELTIVLSGNHFHREMLADGANRDAVMEALRRNVPGVTHFRVSAEDEGGGGVATHPAVQAAVAEFQGEVVAVRPRSPEGEGQ
jgi:hypothetical protein